MSSDRYEAEIAQHVRRLRTRAWRDRARESLLILPAMMLLGAIALALILGEVDTTADAELPLAFTFAPSTASTLLSTIAGATITTAGVVFSLLVVSLQLASGQFSPRVLRGFRRDRLGQVLIGLLLSTFAFCVIALAQLDPEAEHAPALIVLVAVLLALASVLAIVVYLDRLSRQQYVGRIIARVADETLALIEELPYGPRIGVRIGDPVSPPELVGEPLTVPAPGDGWVQQISRRAVIAAVPPNSMVRLETRVGAYIVCGTPLTTIWPAPPEPDRDRIRRLADDAVILGPARTMQQDIDFGLRQLNDIALRALSPAVNDPTTATEVVLRIGSVMRPLLLAELPAQSVRDPAGRILLTPYDLDHTEYIAHAFDQFRLYAANHPHVVLALIRILRMLRDGCLSAGDRPEVVAALDRQIGLALEACRATKPLPEDLTKLEAVAGAPPDQLPAPLPPARS
ncbi:MAG: DUF2254 domain-containing protein [Actinomycetes bacterium]